MKLNPITKQERIESVDILRGFALCGILFINITAFADPDQLFTLGSTLPLADTIVYTLLVLLVESKFFTLFSCLFGLGFAIQISRAQTRGEPFIGRFLRRLLVLALFGIAHIALLWEGDILLLYALVGLLLLLFHNASAEKLLRWIIGLLAVPLALWTLLFIAVVVARQIPATADVLDSADTTFITLLAEEATSDSTYLASISSRLTDYAVSFGLYLTRLPTVLAMYLLGFYVGKRNILRDVAAHRSLLRRVRNWGLSIGLLISGFVAFAVNAFPPITAIVALFFNQALSGPLQAMGYAAALVLWLERPNAQQRLRPLAVYGRMALTNYLGQSLIAFLIFTRLRLANRLTLDWVMLIAVAIIVGQIVFSVWWLRRFRFGPLEWVWRTLTYGTRQPLRQQKSIR